MKQWIACRLSRQLQRRRRASAEIPSSLAPHLKEALKIGCWMTPYVMRVNSAAGGRGSNGGWMKAASLPSESLAIVRSLKIAENLEVSLIALSAEVQSVWCWVGIQLLLALRELLHRGLIF